MVIEQGTITWEAGRWVRQERPPTGYTQGMRGAAKNKNLPKIKKKFYDRVSTVIKAPNVVPALREKILR